MGGTSKGSFNGIRVRVTFKGVRVRVTVKSMRVRVWRLRVFEQECGGKQGVMTVTQPFGHEKLIVYQKGMRFATVRGNFLKR